MRGRITNRNGHRAGVLAIALLAPLAGCATRPTSLPLAAAPPATPRPVPPAGASAELAIPPLGPDGAYRTINSGLSRAAIVWHVRSALNVAALACRGPQETTFVANYNALLASKKTVLKAAFAKTEAESRKAAGPGWRDAHDREMTTTYNFFAQPPAKGGFCAVAAAVGAEAAAVPPAGFDAFAVTALARLEAPFLDFYRAYDGYRRALAAWEAGAPGEIQLAYAPLVTVIAWAPDPMRTDRRFASADVPRRRR